MGEDNLHFDRIAEKYQAAAKSWGDLSRQIGAHLAPLIEGARVLDVGNAGQFPYDTKLPRELVAMDVAPAMLDPIEDPSIVKLVADARNMEGIKDASFDVVVFSLSIHHMNGSSAGASHRMLDEILASACRKLRPGGHLVLAEVLLPKWLQVIETIFFPLTRVLLGVFGVSMIYFHTEPILRCAMAKAFGVEEGAVRSEILELTEHLDPLGGSFPGLIKMPAWLNPADYGVIIGQKPV